jgi:hypothetical protein
VFVTRFGKAFVPVEKNYGHGTAVCCRLVKVPGSVKRFDVHLVKPLRFESVSSVFHRNFDAICKAEVREEPHWDVIKLQLKWYAADGSVKAEVKVCSSMGAGFVGK